MNNSWRSGYVTSNYLCFFKGALRYHLALAVPTDTPSYIVVVHGERNCCAFFRQKKASHILPTATLMGQTQKKSKISFTTQYVVKNTPGKRAKMCPSATPSPTRFGKKCQPPGGAFLRPLPRKAPAGMGAVFQPENFQPAVAIHPPDESAEKGRSDLRYSPIRACWGFGFRGKNRQFFDETRRKNGSIAIPK